MVNHQNAIKSLLKHYNIVHLTANNYHPLKDGEKADLVELTFVRKDVKCEMEKGNIKYPRKELDQPQIPENPQVKNIIFAD